MATVDEVTGNGPETAIIHTLQLLERVCIKNERVDNVTNHGASEIKRELG